ncbi:hypothetical protein CALCODRAFT_513281 [Calocera cornea HHB12733]|uniref:Uncharacterized protein n=1 Tax=Calocera cornea HHB12733 TaxID=1353952 RepID=A0A165C9C2_9BASI|nr:hypothetical protein CALCODRAFT_513281 [Calocera cornea HHB12733]
MDEFHIPNLISSIYAASDDENEWGMLSVYENLAAVVRMTMYDFGDSRCDFWPTVPERVKVFMGESWCTNTSAKYYNHVASMETAAASAFLVDQDLNTSTASAAPQSSDPQLTVQDDDGSDLPVLIKEEEFEASRKFVRSRNDESEDDGNDITQSPLSAYVNELLEADLRACLTSLNGREALIHPLAKVSLRSLVVYLRKQIRGAWGYLPSRCTDGNLLPDPPEYVRNTKFVRIRLPSDPLKCMIIALGADVRLSSIDKVVCYNVMPSNWHLAFINPFEEDNLPPGALHNLWCEQCDVGYSNDKMAGVPLGFRTHCGGPVIENEGGATASYFNVEYALIVEKLTAGAHTNSLYGFKTTRIASIPAQDGGMIDIVSALWKADYSTRMGDLRKLQRSLASVESVEPDTGVRFSDEVSGPRPSEIVNKLDPGSVGLMEEDVSAPYASVEDDILPIHYASSEAMPERYVDLIVQFQDELSLLAEELNSIRDQRPDIELDQLYVHYNKLELKAAEHLASHLMK